MINVAVSGAAGRMGQTVCEAVEGAEDMALVGRADPQLDTALQDVLGDADVVVDFTTPDTALDNARQCLEAGVHCVMGTTGADFSGLEGVAKPDPRIFRLLLDRFDLEPSRTLFVDDNDVNVDAAGRLGIKGWRFVSPTALRANLRAAGLLEG